MQEDIIKALEVLRSGGVILYPTDTIWGLGCDATNAAAVKKIYDIKQRSDNKSMTILMDTSSRIPGYINDVPDIAFDLIEASDKPLIVILEGAKNLAENVIDKIDNSVGIRIVSEFFCVQLIQRFRKPIIFASASISGMPLPANFDEVDDNIIEKVDYVVNYRQDDLSKCKSSSIVKLSPKGGVQIIKP